MSTFHNLRELVSYWDNFGDLSCTLVELTSFSWFIHLLHLWTLLKMGIFVDPKICPKPILTFYFILLFYYYYLFDLIWFLLYFFFFFCSFLVFHLFFPTHVQLQNPSSSYFSLFNFFSLLLSFSFLFVFLSFLSFSLFSLPTLSPKPISGRHLPSFSFPFLIYYPFIFLPITHFSLSLKIHNHGCPILNTLTTRQLPSVSHYLSVIHFLPLFLSFLHFFLSLISPIFFYLLLLLLLLSHSFLLSLLSILHSRNG